MQNAAILPVFPLNKVRFFTKKCCQSVISMVLLKLRMAFCSWLYHMNFVYIHSAPNCNNTIEGKEKL